MEFAEVEVVDIRSRKALESTWRDFFFSHHYMTAKDVFSSYLFTHPRRSCDAFASASLMCEPWHDNRFPHFQTLKELQEWIVPLIAEEELYDKERKAFTGDPLAPNEKTVL